MEKRLTEGGRGVNEPRPPWLVHSAYLQLPEIHTQPPGRRAQCPGAQTAPLQGAGAQRPGTQIHPCSHRQDPPIHTAPTNGGATRTSTRGGGGGLEMTATYPCQWPGTQTHPYGLYTQRPGTHTAPG